MTDFHAHWVIDTREARAKVTEAPEWRTPGGRNPIRPRNIHVTYSIDRGTVGGIEVVGERIETESTNRTRKPYLRRRLYGEESLASAPEWVREFVEQHRPGRS